MNARCIAAGIPRLGSREIDGSAGARPEGDAAGQADREGWVWQAEEIAERDGTRRFFGFVGAHRIARVPAEQVEFIGDWPWTELSRQVDCKLVAPCVGARGGTARNELARETRLPVSVWLRNRSGIDRNVATGPAHFQLFRSKWGGLPVDPRSRGEPERWEELRPVSPARVPPLRSSQPLGATGEWRACDSTLRDHYPDLEPGRYRLVLVFEDASADLASGKSNELMFDLD